MTHSKVDVIDRLHRLGIIAVVRHNSSVGLSQVAAALYQGGIRAIEITLTTPGAIETISRLKVRYDDHELLVGAGTVVDVEQAKAAIGAGARYVVSPSTNLDVIAYCNRNDVVAIPGALTPTEIDVAWRAGADIVKIFPANIVGPSYLMDLAGPLPQIRLMPTGGVDADSASKYFAAGAFAVGVGSAVFGRNLIRDENFDEIRTNAERFVSSINSARRQS